MLASRVPVGGAVPRVLWNLIGVQHMWCLVRYVTPLYLSSVHALLICLILLVL